MAGSIGLLSALLGIGGGIGIVLAGVIIQHLDYHWLFWIPLIVLALSAVLTWRFVPESPVRTPGSVNWVAAGLMTAGITMMLIAICETTTWGWGSARTIVLLAAGLAVCAGWVAWSRSRSRQPLVDMEMMRVRGVWTTNLAAFLLGAGMYSSFIVFPQFVQLPRSTGFGFGASVVLSGLYLLPSTATMFVIGIARRPDLSAVRLPVPARHRRSDQRGGRSRWSPWPTAIRSTSSIFAALLGLGIGLSFAALGTLIVGAVPPHQSGVASGMNTVMRTLGGALGGQLSATFLAGHVAHGLPTVTGFTETFVMATAFLVVCVFASLLVPRPTPGRSGPASTEQPEPEPVEA